MMTFMDHVILEYQKWKQQGDTLRAKAKQAMEVKFRELLSAAITIAEDYHADFGQSLKPPAEVTAFEYTRVAKGRAKKVAAAPKAIRRVPEVKPDPPPLRPDDPKVIALKKRLATAHKKLAAAKAAGQPAKNLEDKVYELEDDLRLALQ